MYIYNIQLYVYTIHSIEHGGEVWNILDKLFLLVVSYTYELAERVSCSGPLF
jgi:hypothetical protein